MHASSNEIVIEKITQVMEMRALTDPASIKHEKKRVKKKDKARHEEAAVLAKLIDTQPISDAAVKPSQTLQVVDDDYE